MDRQAFRNRMQQLKQYREQNPGKTYLDFKQYADGREIPPSSTDETTDHPVNKPFIPSIIEAKDTATGKNFSDLTEYEKDLWRRSHGMDHYGKKIARGNLTEVYPEFDIITGIRGAINTVKNVGTSAYKELSVSDAFNKALNKSDKLEVLKNYPELGQVGTTFQYSKYVDDVFPDSKFNGIFYHGGKKGISKFHTPKDKDFILNKGVHSGTKDHGIYFTKDKLSAENYSRSYPKSNRNVYKVKLNSQNPYKTNDFIGVDIRSYFDKDYVNPRSITDRVRYGKLKNNDSVLWNGEKGEAVVFDPEQIHILGNNSDLKKFSEYTGNKFVDGGEVPPSNKPIIPEEPQPYKGKLYKDRYGRKYTEDQMNEYYDSSTDEIDRFTGKPFIRGLKPVGDIEDAANATPVGDAISAYDTYKALKNKDWEGAGLAAMGLIPFMPMTVKQFRSKYKGITPKQKYRSTSNNYNTSVNKNYVQDRINESIAYDAAVTSKLSKAANQTYSTIERLMDDPEYMIRAKQVKEKFGDDYISAYADVIDRYNNDPFSLPNIEVLKNNTKNSRASMTWHNGNYYYRIDPDLADLNFPITEHELSHYVDHKRNLDRPDPHGDSNMFYQMQKDISNKKIDTNDEYYSRPTEQKAHMNQLREYMFQNNYIKTRGETVDEKLLKKAMQEAEKHDSMKGMIRASKQFKSFNKYTKWFNSIPLLGVGAAAVYNNNQE